MEVILGVLVYFIIGFVFAVIDAAKSSDTDPFKSFTLMLVWPFVMFVEIVFLIGMAAIKLGNLLRRAK